MPVSIGWDNKIHHVWHCRSLTPHGFIPFSLASSAILLCHYPFPTFQRYFTTFLSHFSPTPQGNSVTTFEENLLTLLQQKVLNQVSRFLQPQYPNPVMFTYIAADGSKHTWCGDLTFGRVAELAPAVNKHKNILIGLLFTHSKCLLQEKFQMGDIMHKVLLTF